jgi:L-arabinose transport system permease protein
MREPRATDWKLQNPLRILWEQAGMFLVFAVLFVACCIFVENFRSRFNMISLALMVSTTGIVACTMLFCLASGNFDLSVGSVAACCGVVTAVVINRTSRWIMAEFSLEQMTAFGSATAVVAGILVGIAAGGVVGLLNGVIVAKFKINALITTLATMQMARGFAYIVSGGNAVGVREKSFFLLGNSAILRTPTPIWITAVCFVIFGLMLRKTTLGRNTLAVGGNEEAARLAGIPVDRLKIMIFSAQGLMAGLAGIVLASRMTSGQPMVLEGFELQVISACVLGGVSLTGGVGSMLHVISGVLIMGTVENAMNLETVPTFWQYVVRGGILLGAVLFDHFKQRRQG